MAVKRMSNSKQLDWQTSLAFFIVVILGGSNAVAVRFSNLELPPFWGAAFRFGSAALIFWLIVLVRKIALPRSRALKGTIIYGVLTIGISYSMLYWALLYIPPSITMVIGAMGPLFTFFFALAHGQEPFRWQGLAGGLMAFVGILLGIGDRIGDSLPLIPILAVVVGFAAVSEGTVLYKSYPKSDPLSVNAISLSVGTVMLLLVSLFARESWALPATQTTWIAYAYLVVGGSVGLFYLYLFILGRWTASATSYTFLLFPVATILISSWLVDEVITPRFLGGAAVVLLGVWIGVIVKPKEKPVVGEPGSA